MKVIHFEDDEFLGRMYKVKFENSGFEYGAFGHPPKEPEELIQLILSEKPGLIIMSVIMPIMDGFTATKIIKSDDRTKNIPLCFLTNLSTKDNVDMGMKLGAIKYFINAKITPDKLVEETREIIRNTGHTKARLISEYGYIVEKVIKRLKNGESRLTFCPSQYNISSTYSCLNDFSTEDFSEEISSDYGIPTKYPRIEKDFYEEITLIEKILQEENVSIKYSDWQRSDIKSVESMHKSINRRSYAIQIWNYYAIPWRYYENIIYLIWAPNDILGSPKIHSYGVNDFLCLLALKALVRTKGNIKNEIRMEKRLKFWKSLGLVTGGLISLMFMYLLIKLGQLLS